MAPIRSQKSQFDVAIIGGGPAGTSAALTLLDKSSLSVCVIESTDYSNIRMGESVSPSMISVLRYLSFEDDFLKKNHLPSYGIDASWGSSKIFSRDFFFTGQGNGWNLNRSTFDCALALEVKKRSGTLLTNTNLVSQTKNGKKWRLTTVDDKQNNLTITANFVIDASGKNAVFARNTKTKWAVLDYLVGVCSIYEIADNDEQSFTLIESTENGWWYSTLIPNNKRVVVFMTDSDIAATLKLQNKKNWNTILSKTLHIQKTINDAKMIFGLQIFPAFSQMVTTGDFSYWVPAGDAAASFDPLSSMGIGHAMTSGIQCARIAHDALKSDGELASKYQKDITKNFAEYLHNRKHFYGLEKRWTDQPFWKRRL